MGRILVIHSGDFKMWNAALHSVVFVGGERSIYMGVVCHPWVFDSRWELIHCSSY